MKNFEKKLKEIQEKHEREIKKMEKEHEEKLREIKRKIEMGEISLEEIEKLFRNDNESLKRQLRELEARTEINNNL